MRHGLGLREGVILGLGLAVSMVSWLAFRPFDLVDAFMIGAPFGRDFVNFWSAPHLVLAGQAPVLGDVDAYNAAIRAAFGHVAPNRMIFSYPPHALLVLLPFGALPYLPALVAFTALNLAALAAATRLLAPGRPLLWALACLSPSSAAMVMYGHFGGLLALAASLALIESGRRPGLAGLLLALTSVKPQFALVLALVLLAGGRWRCLAAASAFTAGLVALSLAAFGTGPWERFLEVVVPLQGRLLGEFARTSLATATSFYVSARFWDLPGWAASLLQGVLGGCAFLVAALAMRTGERVAEPARLLVVLLGCLLALPYANHYDLAVVAPALTVLLFGRGEEPSPLAELSWLIAPAAKLLAVAALPVIPFVLAAFLAGESRRLGLVPSPRSVRRPC